MYLVYTEFILVWLCRKLEAYKHTLESIPWTNQYWAISVKFLAQENNEKPLTGFEPTPFLQSFDYKSETLTTGPRSHNDINNEYDILDDYSSILHTEP